MAVRSGRKVDISLATGPVEPRFLLAGPHAPGLVYTLEGGIGEEFSLLADTSVSVASRYTAHSDIRATVTNAAALHSDLLVSITGTCETIHDVKLVVTGLFETLTDVAVIVSRVIDPYNEDNNTYQDGARNPALEYLGKGLKFPFTFQRRSGGTQISTATSSDHAHIHESIRQILGTRKGERFMRPEFGTRLHELIFEPNDTVLYGLIRHEVTDALDQWEPRVIVTDVLVGPGDDEHLVLVNISYRLISSQVEGNMVYPFFRELE